MRVTLEYFDPNNGAWHAEGSFESQLAALHQVISEVKWLKQRRELPGLKAGHPDFTVLITIDGYGAGVTSMHLLPGATELTCPICDCRLADGFRSELEHHRKGCPNTPIGVPDPSSIVKYRGMTVEVDLKVRAYVADVRHMTAHLKLDQRGFSVGRELWVDADEIIKATT